MADTWDEGTAGLLLSDAPPLIAEAPGKQTKKPTSRPAGRKKSKDARTLRPAADKPVARIAVDLPLAHLDRPFDYLVPERLADQARPGVRVRVRFAGQADRRLPDRTGRRQRAPGQPPLPGAGGLRRAGAHRGDRRPGPRRRRPLRGHPRGRAPAGGTAAARRHGSGRRRRPPPAADAASPATGCPRPDPGPWARYPAGPSFLDALAAGRPARAAWTALPGPAWPEEIARAAVTTASAGRGAVIVVPDARDLARVDEALAALTPPADPAHPAGRQPPTSRSPPSSAPRSGTVAGSPPCAARP